MICDKTAALKEALGEEADDGGNVNLQVEVEMTPQQAKMDQFLARVDDVRMELKKMTEKTNQVQKLHSEILSSSHPDDKAKQQLDDIMAEFKKSASKVKANINEIGQETKALDAENNNVSQRMKKTQHSTLRNKFVEVMTEFNNVQSSYRDKYKGRIQRQLEITGRTTTDEELDDMFEQGNVEIFTQGIIMETQQARQQLADIEARHADIVKLESSIKELYDLFIDMAVLVENQGEMVDRIENHVVQAQEYVETAKVETGQAVRHQSKARKKKILIGICLVVLLLVIILIIALSV